MRGLVKLVAAVLLASSWLALPYALAWACTPPYYDNIPAWLHAVFGIANLLSRPSADWNAAYSDFAAAKRQGLYLHIVQGAGVTALGFLLLHAALLCRHKDWHARRTIVASFVAAVIPWLIVSAYRCPAIIGPTERNVDNQSALGTAGP